MKDTIHIAFCTDQNYIMPTGVTMISVCENNKNANLCFHIVLTEGDTSKELQDIADKYGCDIEFHPLESDKLPDVSIAGLTGITLSTFARWFIPDLVDAEVSKMLYLDSDIVVMDSLSDLWNINIDDYPVAAVVDAESLEPRHRKALALSYEYSYFNAGVQLMNLGIWREEKLCQALCECAVEKRFHFLDQDTINWYLKGRILTLPVKYNMQMAMYYQARPYVDYMTYDEWQEFNDRPTIFHFSESEAKPWKYVGSGFNDVWMKYASMSCWKNDIHPKSQGHGQWKESFKGMIDTAYNSYPEKLILSFPEYYKFFISVARLKKGGKVLSLINSLFKIVSKIFDKIYSYKLSKLQ